MHGIISWSTTSATTTTAVTWTLWNATYSDPWGAWNTSACTTNGTTAASVWGDPWGAWQRKVIPAPYRPAYPERRAPTPEEQAAAAAAERERIARQDAMRAARLEAERKAEALLLRHLLPEQREEYQRTKSFTVKLPSGALYRINKGRAGNVELAAPVPLIEGASPNVEVVAANQKFVACERLCIHPDVAVPDCDNMLAQKLMLETDEQNFRRIANITRLAGGAR